MQTKITGKFYERKKCCIAGIWLFVSVIIGAASIYFLPGKISGIFNTLNDIVILLALFSSLILFLLGYITFIFFRSIKILFVTEDQKLKIKIPKTRDRFRVFDVDEYEFVILATSSAKSIGTRIVLELLVNFNSRRLTFTENLENRNLSINVKSDDGIFIEDLFCRTPGTLLKLYNELKNQKSATSAQSNPG
jgi:hypothetical protein